jgi:hypothetical protein
MLFPWIPAFAGMTLVKQSFTQIQLFSAPSAPASRSLGEGWSSALNGF